MGYVLLNAVLANLLGYFIAFTIAVFIAPPDWLEGIDE